MKLTISSCNWAKRHKRKFDAIITIEDPDKRNGLRFYRDPHPAHLIQKYVDLDRPAPGAYAQWPILRLATENDVWEAIDFANGRENLLVHCEAGIGRSTAIALAILVSHLKTAGDHDDLEQLALDRLLEIRPESAPNLHIVALTDKVLDRNGRLIHTVEKWDSTNVENQRRRKLNRRAHFNAVGLGLVIPDGE